MRVTIQSDDHTLITAVVGNAAITTGSGGAAAALSPTSPGRVPVRGRARYRGERDTVVPLRGRLHGYRQR